MKNALKKLALLTACSLFALLGCTKQSGSLSVIEKSQNNESSLIETSSDIHIAFTEYDELKIIVAHQDLLTSNDKKLGACFSNRAELVNYANQLRFKNSELDKFVNELIDEDFENKKLEADVDLKGRIILAMLVIPAVKVWFNKNIKYIRKKIRGFKKL